MNEYTYRLWIAGHELGNVYSRLAHIARVIEHLSTEGSTVIVDIITSQHHDSAGGGWVGIPGIENWAYLPSLDEIYADDFQTF